MISQNGGDRGKLQGQKESGDDNHKNKKIIVIFPRIFISNSGYHGRNYGTHQKKEGCYGRLRGSGSM